MKIVDMLESYINAGISPILLEDINADIFKNAVLIEANCSKSELNGHYEGQEFVPPKWYKEVMENNNKKSLVVIKNINKVSSQEQLKFMELFKYQKIGIFELPKNCTIVATCENLEIAPIVEDIYSLMVHIY